MIGNRVRIDLCCEKKIQTLQHDFDGMIDYIDISSVDNIKKKIISFQTIDSKEAPSRAKQLLKNGDIIVSTVRPNLNAVALVENMTPNTMVGSTGYCVLRCNHSLDKSYLFHFCQSQYFIDDMTSQATGASYPAVSSTIVRNSLIPLPPLKKQKQIAATLDKVTDLIDKRRKQLEKLDELVKARFVEMFGDIFTKSQKYQIQKLGDVAFVGSSHRVFTNEFVNKGIPFYRGTEIGELANGIKPSDPYYISEEHYKRLSNDESKPKIGDLLMPSICNKGQIWMVDTEEPFYYKDGRVLCISANREIYNTKYLQYYLREKTQIEYSKLGSGSTFAEFKIFILKELDILTPPINIQTQFADFVTQVDKQKSLTKQSLEKLETLKKSLMQEYFG